MISTKKLPLILAEETSTQSSWIQRSRREDVEMLSTARQAHLLCISQPSSVYYSCVKSPPILVWKIWTHSNLFIALSKSGPVLESLHLFPVPLFSCGCRFLKKAFGVLCWEHLCVTWSWQISPNERKWVTRRVRSHCSVHHCCVQGGCEACLADESLGLFRTSASLLWGRSWIWKRIIETCHCWGINEKIT